MSDLVFKGKVIAISEPRTGSNAKGSFTINGFTLEEVEGDYKDSLTIETFSDEAHDRWAQMNIKMGEVVTAHLSTRSYESNGRRWNNITCWKVDHEIPMPGKMEEAVTILKERDAKREQQQSQSQGQGELPF